LCSSLILKKRRRNMLEKIKENVSKVMIDKETEIELMIIALLSDGHVLLEDAKICWESSLSFLDGILKIKR
jgi:MoxR-like ATPase